PRGRLVGTCRARSYDDSLPVTFCLSAGRHVDVVAVVLAAIRHPFFGGRSLASSTEPKSDPFLLRRSATTRCTSPSVVCPGVTDKITASHLRAMRSVSTESGTGRPMQTANADCAFRRSNDRENWSDVR